MSDDAREALEDGTPYLQPPVDDIYSFYWVALWATLRNTHFQSRTERERAWLENINLSRTDRMAVAAEIGPGRLQRALPTFSPLLQSMWFLLKDWRGALNIRTSDWRNLEVRDAEVKGVPIGRRYCGLCTTRTLVLQISSKLLPGIANDGTKWWTRQSQMWILVTILSYYFNENERDDCQQCAITINSQD